MPVVKETFQSIKLFTISSQYLFFLNFNKKEIMFQEENWKKKFYKNRKFSSYLDFDYLYTITEN